MIRKKSRSRPTRKASSVRHLPRRKTSSAKTRRVLFVASECHPFAKTGGLGDVVGALPKHLKKAGWDVRILMPLYATVDRNKWGLKFESSCCVHMGRGEEQWVGIHRAMATGRIPIYFVEYDRFFNRPGIYHDRSGEYLDNAYRFALLSKTALQITKDQNWIPDVIHAHDWCSALVPLFLKTWDRILSPLSKTASVLTIHNIGYQGVYTREVMGYLGVGDSHFSPQELEDHGKINLLKGGIYHADALTTVSPTHARELLDPVGGCGLAPYLERRKNDLFGILNGVDEEEWNPQTDHFIPATYSSGKMQGKERCKRALQQRLGLVMDSKVPLFGVVSRFAHQKGFDLMKEALPLALRDMKFQLAVLGTGDRDTEDFFRWLSASYPGRVGCHIGFSLEWSHWIEAGSDFFLMPSLYEPCGLNQMYSMSYGTLPLVRSTGGLNDTIENYQEETGAGTGFKFLLPTGRALYDTMGWAVSTWFDRPHHIKQMQKQAMKQSFRWEDAARKYIEVYEYAIQKRQSEA